MHSLHPAEVFLSADLALIFVNHLNEETLFLTNYYKMAEGFTGIVIKRDAIFLTERIAHEIGHVLGAGHPPDPSKHLFLVISDFILR